MKIFGSLPIKRLAWSFDDYLASAIKKINYGRTLLIFPEGSVINKKGLSKPKAGIGYLAVNHKVQILPIKLEGLADLKIMDLIMRRRQLQMWIGTPFKTNKGSKELATYQRIAGSVMLQITSLS